MGRKIAAPDRSRIAAKWPSAETAAPSRRSEAADAVAAPSAVSSRGPRPTPRPAAGLRVCPNKESGCAARARQSSPRTPVARAPGDQVRGGVLGDGEGRLGQSRAPLRPPDVARRKMLQPWTAPRSASQVQGATAEGGSAAGTAALCEGRWEGRDGPQERPPPWPAPPWLAGTVQRASAVT